MPGRYLTMMVLVALSAAPIAANGVKFNVKDKAAHKK